MTVIAHFAICLLGMPFRAIPAYLAFIPITYNTLTN